VKSGIVLITFSKETPLFVCLIDWLISFNRNKTFNQKQFQQLLSVD
jgi:hypothetical protein